jgi:LacI family transcriptional regulator
MALIRIAIMMDTSGGAGRLMLRGIGAYARTNRAWNCQFQLPTAANIARLRVWQPDGIIMAVYDPSWLELLKIYNIPIVDVADTLSHNPYTIVSDDNERIGQLGAQYFIERGFKTCAFVGLPDENYSRQRRDSFVRTIYEAGGNCLVHEVGNTDASELHSRITLSNQLNKKLYKQLLQQSHEDWNIKTADDALRTFIKTFPDTPIGVFAANDGRAIQFMEAGLESGLNVPDKVAVLGCDNDDLLCDLARPPLSSIAPAHQMIGYQAAAMLDRLLRGETPVAHHTKIAPLSIITRQSSEITAVNDPDLTRALRYIRANAHRPFRGDEVVDEVMISRRALERRFTSLLGRTLHDEIQRVHIEQARQLLTHTDLQMPAIADKSGFGSLRSLSITFRQIVGMTPSAYRQKHRLR